MMVEATTPIIRYVWGEHYGYYLCEHEPLQESVKVMHTERQTFIGIPESDIGIFLIRKKVMFYDDTSNDFKEWYKRQVRSMTEDQKIYKIKRSESILAIEKLIYLKVIRLLFLISLSWSIWICKAL